MRTLRVSFRAPDVEFVSLTLRYVDCDARIESAPEWLSDCFLARNCGTLQIDEDLSTGRLYSVAVWRQLRRCLTRQKLCGNSRRVSIDEQSVKRRRTAREAV